MDYIWLYEYRDADWWSVLSEAQCYGSSVYKRPDVAVPLTLMQTANSNPKILDNSSFPMNSLALDVYLANQGIIEWRNGVYAAHAETLTGLSTSPVPERKHIEREWKYKGGGTNAEWKAAQEKGSTLIRPLYTGSYALKDVLVPRIGAKAVTESGLRIGMFEHAPLIKQCLHGQKLRKAPGFDGYVYNDYDSYFYRSFLARAHLHKMGDVTTLFRLQAPPIEYFVTFLENQEHPSGLVNPTLEKLNAGVYDILTELAELSSTIQYIYSALRRIILAFIGIKSREVKLAKKYGYGSKEFIDELAGLWMSFRYAASPIAYSIQDAQKVLAAQQKVFITERGRKDVPFSYSRDGYTFSGTLEWRCFAKAKVQGATVGLGLNPIRTLWEVTPLAFVVNWVLPVGSMLSALMPPSGAKQTVASLSYRVRGVKITYQHNGKTITVPNKIDIYKVKPIEPTAEFDLWPQLHMNWKRSLDGMALSWSMFLKQFWKSKP